MMKKLLFMAALLVPGLAYGQNPSANLSVQVVPGSDPPNGMACAIGPNYTGTIPIDVQTAGFTTCALNSDFSTSSFATVSNWLGGDKTSDNCGAGTGAGPIWYNSNNSSCGDYSIITDGSNGQVLDIRWTNADLAAGQLNTQMISIPGIPGPGQLYPSGMYVEQYFRLTTQTINSVNGASKQWLIFQPFKYSPNGTANGTPFIEWDWNEFYFNPIGISGGSGVWGGASGVTGPFPTAMQICPTRCTNFDPSIYHTYGELVTTDGNQAMSQCAYLDGVKLGCQNFTGVTPATKTWQAREQLVIELGPGNGSPNVFNGPADVFIKYIRVFSCSTWNAANAVCSGPLVTQ